MLQLYKEKPVTISMMNRKRMVNVEFCNVSMNLKFCQFKLFHNYLMNKLREVNGETKEMNLLLVRDNLNISISLNDFIQLTHGVESVMLQKFVYKPNKYMT
tara:strand:- start:1933 stop:2235 length:303 start_codon:yes stop_codon:yes gene_type:complete